MYTWDQEEYLNLPDMTGLQTDLDVHVQDVSSGDFKSLA